jgi:hypothetical protein
MIYKALEILLLMFSLHIQNKQSLYTQANYVLKNCLFNGCMKVVKTYNDKSIKIEKQLIKSIANSLAEEMARKMHYKLLLLKFLSEIKAVGEGTLKTLKGKEIEKIFNSLIKLK